MKEDNRKDSEYWELYENDDKRRKELTETYKWFVDKIVSREDLDKNAVELLFYHVMSVVGIIGYLEHSNSELREEVESLKNRRDIRFQFRKTDYARFDAHIEELKTKVRELENKLRFGGFASYNEYLKSSHWKDVRERALKQADRKCSMCTNRARLNVHHRTYARLGAEWDNDVVVLCRSCHAKLSSTLPNPHE